jgi:microcin C transport system substrate-binding protein
MDRSLLLISWLVALGPFTVAKMAAGQAATGLAGGVALHGQPKYTASNDRFEYSDPRATTGGKLTVAAFGNFDTLNPFGSKGIAATRLAGLVFQDLAEQSLDEPFTMYPALAESFVIAPDKLSIEITLRANATFSDGKPVTIDDLLFSYELFLSDKVLPFYKSYYADFKGIEKTGPRSAKITFKQLNPELALIATQLSVLPKHIYGKGDFGRDFTDIAVGTGPYTVKDFKRGQYITYARNDKFWGKELGVFKGRFNFDEITVKYYKDEDAMFQGYLAEDFDIYPIYSAKTWAVDLKGDKIDKLKWIQKVKWAHENNEGSQGFLFNLRNKKFEDIRVRKAIALAFDFEWSNKNLFYDQYVENTSFFENSPLKAKGMPSPEELAVLKDLPELDPAVLNEPVGSLSQEKDIKKRLREAKRLLTEAGYKVENNVATGPAGPLKIEFLLSQKGFLRVIEPWMQNLKKIGVEATVVHKEESEYQRRVEGLEFEMIVFSRDQSQSPGNEQRNQWGSAAADEKYSQNSAGLKSKAVDAIIDKLIYADSREKLELMTRCLDRVLYHQHFLVHNWHIDHHRVTYWAKFGIPAQLPKFYLPTQALDYLWFDKQAAAKLAEAKAAGKGL